MTHRTINDRRKKALEQVESRIKFHTHSDGHHFHGDRLAGQRLGIALQERDTLLARIR